MSWVKIVNYFLPKDNKIQFYFSLMYFDVLKTKISNM